MDEEELKKVLIVVVGKKGYLYFKFKLSKKHRRILWIFQ
jgi:hypothetical protein